MMTIIGPRSRVRPSEGGRFFGLAFGLCDRPFRCAGFFFAAGRFFFVVLRVPATIFSRAAFLTELFFAVLLAARLAVFLVCLRTVDFFAARFFAMVMEGRSGLRFGNLR